MGFFAVLLRLEPIRAIIQPIQATRLRPNERKGAPLASDTLEIYVRSTPSLNKDLAVVHRPNPVQTIAQQRQQFQTPPVQQVQHWPAPQPAAEQHRPVDDLAEEIYVRLVAGRYLDPNFTEPPDQANLRQWARDAQTAATAYFATLEQEESTNG